MNRGGRGNSRGGKSQGSWRPKPADSSPNNQTPVRGDVSPGGSMSSASVEKSCSSGQAAEKNSGGGMYRNVTPAMHQRGGWATFGSGSISNEGNVGKSTPSSNAVEKNSGVEKSNSAGHAVEKNSGGGIYRNVTPATRRGGGGGWSNFGGGSSSSGGNVSSNASGFHRDERFGLGSGQLNLSGTAEAQSKGDSDSSSVNLDRAFMKSLVHPTEAAQLSGESVPLKSCSEVKTQESTDSLRETENSEFPIEKFDLCPPQNSGGIKLKTSLLSMNREKRKEKNRLSSGLQGDILRSGMVLLKNYLSISEQASILTICREHGLVNVGFHQPQFGEGGKMHLKLMCFGQFWNPETNKYEEVRPIDHSKPPPIPPKLLELVDRAVKDSQSLISERQRVKNVESILPSVKPDICLVNYYSKTGRLGLHQDKDESQESLRKEIPIVSFSIGDSAEFSYGDQRDVEKAEKVVLESGDVLIFGGKSRHIFHGVPAIKPDTAPKTLLDETNFRSGRLNLTFRQRC